MAWNNIDVDGFKKKLGMDGKDNRLEIEDEEGNLLNGDDEIDAEFEDEDNQGDDQQDGRNDSKDQGKGKKGDKDKTKDGQTEEDLDKKKQREQQHKSRAAERIRALVQKNKELEEKYAKDTGELQTRLKNTSKVSVESEKQNLDSLITSNEVEAARLLAEGEAGKAVEILSKNQALQTRRMALETYKTDDSDEGDKNKNPQQQGNQKPISREARLEAARWIGKNDWFNKDANRRTVAVELSQELDNEGYDPESRDYYDELDSRIKDFFGDTDEGDNGVTDDNKNDSSNESKTKKKAQQTTSGASRTPAPSNKKRVTLTARDVEIARKLSLPLDVYARQKQLSNNKDEAGYTTVGIPARK